MINDLGVSVGGNSSLLSQSKSEDQADIANESYQVALDVATAADERKGSDIIILRVSEVSYLTDYLVIVTGFSDVQVRAIARAIEAQIEERWQRTPLNNSEGKSEGNWILQDYGDVIAHIFLPETREFYNLEAFWGHAERLKFVPPNV